MSLGDDWCFCLGEVELLYCLLWFCIWWLREVRAVFLWDIFEIIVALGLHAAQWHSLSDLRLPCAWVFLHERLHHWSWCSLPHALTFCDSLSFIYLAHERERLTCLMSCKHLPWLPSVVSQHLFVSCRADAEFLITIDDAWSTFVHVIFAAELDKGSLDALNCSRLPMGALPCMPAPNCTSGLRAHLCALPPLLLDRLTYTLQRNLTCSLLWWTSRQRGLRSL